MASAGLSRRVEKVVGYPPLSEVGDLQRREFHEALLDADGFEDLPGSGRPPSSELSRSGPSSGSSTARYFVGIAKPELWRPPVGGRALGSHDGGRRALLVPT
jgi:hypothetical protein